MYKVVRDFKDRDGQFYRAGDDFPASDVRKQTVARIKTLSSADNAYGQIFIKKIDAPKAK